MEKNIHGKGKKTRFLPTYKELKLAQLETAIRMHDRFLPTYKELKPFSKAKTRKTGGCRFLPTYKELKHRRSCIHENNSPGFLPTYKELKLQTRLGNRLLAMQFSAYL